MSEIKNLFEFCIILMFKGIMTWKIPHTILQRPNLCFSSNKNHKSKVNLLELGKEKRGHFLTFVFYLNV